MKLLYFPEGAVTDPQSPCSAPRHRTSHIAIRNKKKSVGLRFKIKHLVHNRKQIRLPEPTCNTISYQIVVSICRGMHVQYDKNFETSINKTTNKQRSANHSFIITDITIDGRSHLLKPKYEVPYRTKWCLAYCVIKY
jgi:hypothetical protein